MAPLAIVADTPKVLHIAKGVVRFAAAQGLYVACSVLQEVLFQKIEETPRAR